MLGVSFSELAITCIVAFFIIRSQDIKKLAYWYKYILKQITELKAIAQDSIDEINKELKEEKLDSATESKYVIDNDKKLQKTYDSDPLIDKKDLTP